MNVTYPSSYLTSPHEYTITDFKETERKLGELEDSTFRVNNIKRLILSII